MKFSRQEKIKDIEDKIEELRCKVHELKKEDDCDEQYDGKIQNIREILERHCDYPVSQTTSVHKVEKGCKFGDYDQRYTAVLTEGSWIPELQQLDKSLKCAGFKLSYISSQGNDKLYLLIDTKCVPDNTKCFRTR